MASFQGTNQVLAAMICVLSLAFFLEWRASRAAAERLSGEVGRALGDLGRKQEILSSRLGGIASSLRGMQVAAVAVVAVVIVENTPERRMDRKLDRLLRLYEDDPKQLYQRLDDRDLLGFVLVNSFLRYNGPRCASPGTLSPPRHQHLDLALLLKGTISMKIQRTGARSMSCC